MGDGIGGGAGVRWGWGWGGRRADHVDVCEENGVGDGNRSEEGEGCVLLGSIGLLLWALGFGPYKAAFVNLHGILGFSTSVFKCFD